MDRLHIVIAETMGTDGEFYTETYPCRNDKDAFDTMCELIEEMAVAMEIDIPTEDIGTTRELNGEGWWYRVKDQVFDGFL